MIFIILLLSASFFSNSECMIGDNYYSKLMDQWKFAYNVISDISIEYLPFTDTTDLQKTISGETNTTSEPQTVLLNDLDVTWDELPNSAFVVPLVSYPIAIIYNIPLLTEPLKLTRQLLLRILNTSVTWNDPELVALNPGLSSIFTPIRMTLNQQTSNINQLIIDYVYQDYNVSDRQISSGSWIGLAATQHRLSTDYIRVLFSVTATLNSLAFIPLPLAVSTTTGISFAQFVSPQNQSITMEDVPQINLENIQTGKTKITFENDESSWPMNIIGYLMYDQDRVDCDSILETIRFFFWSCNNTNLVNTTLSEGFHMINPMAINHLLESNCRGSLLLLYDNLSDVSRSKFLLGFSITLTLIFMGMIMFRFYQGRKNMSMQDKRKYRFRSAFHSFTIIFGLVLFLVGSIIWYFPASEDWICISRMVFTGLGICFVISSAFMYAFAFARNVRGQGKDQQTSVRVIFISCILVSVLEGLLLLFWMIFDRPSAMEIVQDAIAWESRYVCYSESSVPELIQYIYFCIIIIYGCVEVNHYWKEKGVLDPRLLLGSLYSELLIFIILIVMSTLIEFTDENLYIVKVSLYLIAVGNISGAWFMQSFVRWIAEFKKNSSNSDKVTTSPVTYNSNSEYSIPTSVAIAEPRRNSSDDVDLPQL